MPDPLTHYTALLAEAEEDQRRRDVARLAAVQAFDRELADLQEEDHERRP